MAFAIVLQSLYSDEFHIVFFGQLDQFRGTHHGTVFTHYFAAESAFLKTCQAKEIDGGFRVAVSLQYAVFLGFQREHVPGAAEILRLGIFIDTGSCGQSAFFCGDAGSSVHVVDRNGERCFVVVGVFADHLRELQLHAVLCAHRHADQTLGFFGHKVHVFGRCKFCGADHVSFVFAIFVVGHEDDFSLTQIF